MATNNEKTIENECIICGGKNFTLTSGFYFCQECGTQSQDIREIEIDENLTAGLVIRDKHKLNASVDRNSMKLFYL